MNPLQMALQIKHKLQEVAWPLGSGEVVFGSYGVAIFAGTPNEEQFPAGYPWVLVTPGSGRMDPDHPELITQTFGLMVAAEVAGDPQGEFALVGGSISDLGKSAGRGVMEVSERARFAVQDLTGADGAKIIVTSTSTGGPFTMGQGRHIAVAELTLECLCTSQEHYAAPQHLTHTGGDGGTWSWEGAHCSDRFDFLQYRLVQKAGSSPSTDPSDGTVLYTGTTASTTGSATSGNTYTVFADYDARGGGAVEDSSEPEVGSYVVVP